MPLDVTIIAGRRPDLLRPTLDSFAAGLFAGFEIAGVYANLDPIFGDAVDHAACVAAIRARFPGATLFEPPSPSFGAAVQRVWAATRSDLVFHLEDDWRLNEPVGPEDIAPVMTGATRAAVLVSRELHWNGADVYNVRRRRVSVLGLTLYSRDFQVFGTSPRFLDGAFARTCARLINPRLDPEKQMRTTNRELIAYLQNYRCRYLAPKSGRELITDTGRLWRDDRRITKTVANAVSTWTFPK